MMDTRVATSDDVHRLQRRTLILIIVFVVGVTMAGWFFGPKIVSTNSAVKATRDTLNLQIQTNLRNACITERRTNESRASGEEDDARTVITVLMNENAIPPEVVAVFESIYGETFNLSSQYQRVTVAIKARKDATASLDAKVLNQPPPAGCGPPAQSKTSAP